MSSPGRCEVVGDEEMKTRGYGRQKMVRSEADTILLRSAEDVAFLRY